MLLTWAQAWVGGFQQVFEKSNVVAACCTVANVGVVHGFRLLCASFVCRGLAGESGFVAISLPGPRRKTFLERVPGGTECTFVRIPAVPPKFRRAREQLCSSRIPGLFQLESGRVNPAPALPRVLKQMKTALLQLATAETYPTSASADGQRKPGSSLPGVLGRNAAGVVEALVRSPSQRCSPSPGQSLLGGAA